MASFEALAERVKLEGSGLSTDNKLNIYSLFKQATVGDCNVSRPGFFDMSGRAKWDAWNRCKGMPSEVARESYVELALSILPDAADPTAAADGEQHMPQDPGSFGFGPVSSTLYVEEEVLLDEDKGMFDWVKEGNVAVLQRLLQEDAAGVLERRDDEGMTALHWATDQNQVEAIKMLAEAGIEINARDNEGQTALYLGAMCDHEAAVGALVELGRTRR